MQITHNGKTYRWIGDKWGEKSIDEMFIVFDELRFSYRNGIHILSHHTPEQLVKL
jgi:hypothetical protein